MKSVFSSKTGGIKKSMLYGLLMMMIVGSMQVPVYADDQKAAAAAPSGAASSPAGADGSTGAAGSGSASTSGVDPSSTSSASPMQAGVQMIELNLTMLTHVGLDIKNLLKATDSLYDEVTIQPVSVITEPEVIGRGIIVNIPVGTQPVGPPAPPKKARVDLAMSHMRPVVSTLKADVDEFESGKARLDISDDTRKDLHPYFDTWIKTVNDISTNMAKLESVTTGPPYDNSSIAQAVGIVHQDAQRLDEVRRKIYKYLQKEGKQKKKKNA